MGAVAVGLGMRAVARVVAVDPHMVLQWLSAVANHTATFSQSFLHDLRVTQGQLEARCALRRAVQAGEVREAEAITRLSRAPHGVWGALDPMHQQLLTIDVGARTLAMAPGVVHQVAQRVAPDGVPLLLTDGLKESTTAFLTPVGRWA